MSSCKKVLRYKFKCEDNWINYGENCYKLFKESSDWYVAKNKCEASGASLVNIDDQDELNFINFGTSQYKLWVIINSIFW